MARRHIVIIGATSVIAQHCARLWVARGDCDLVLVARDLDKAERAAADLRVRDPAAAIRVLEVDFCDPLAIDALCRSVTAHGVADIVLIAQGALPDQLACQGDLMAIRQALDINAVSPVLFAEGFAGPMARSGGGTLALIGSVAGDRGRRSNYLYGAAKGLVERYAQGLRHRLVRAGVAVVLIKPGPTDTPMTAALAARVARLAAPADVARTIVAAIDRRRPVVYAPRRWAAIMMVIRHLPRFLFDRLDL